MSDDRLPQCAPSGRTSTGGAITGDAIRDALHVVANNTGSRVVGAMELGEGFQRIRDGLDVPGGGRLYRVKLRETARNHVEYFGEDGE